MKVLLSLLALILPALSMAADKPAMPEHPVLAVTTVDGKAWQLADQRGQWVIVNFWATWCSPCIKEMPEIDQFVARHKNVAAIGLAWQDADTAAIESFLAKHPVRYPIAIVDPFKPLADFEPPRGLPTTYVIGPDGRVVKKHLGPVTAIDLAKLVGVKPE